MKRVRDLPEAEIAGTHYNQEDITRRLKLYRTANNSQVAEPSVQDFFNKQGIKIFTESVTTQVLTAMSAFKIYIERVSIFPFDKCLSNPRYSSVQNEKPYNYMTYDEEEETDRRVEYEKAREMLQIFELAKVKQ